MNRFALLLLLFLPAGVYAQIPGAIQIGEVVSQADVDRARQIIEASKPLVFNWNVGEFQIFQKGSKAKGDLTWDWDNEGIITIKEIPANVPLMAYGVRAGTGGTAQWHNFPAQKDSYLLFMAVKEGTAKVTITAVSDDGKKSIIVAKMQITVGKPTPKPDDPPDNPPIEDDLTKGMRVAFAKDKAANIADPKFLLALSGIYEAASKDDLANIKTAGDLDTLLNSARQAAGIPDPDKMLTETRQYIKRQLQANLGKDQAQPLSVDAKRLAKVLMGKISDALEKLAK